MATSTDTRYKHEKEGEGRRREIDCRGQRSRGKQDNAGKAGEEKQGTGWKLGPAISHHDVLVMITDIAEFSFVHPCSIYAGSRL